MIQNIADYINREITFNNNHHDINAHMCSYVQMSFHAHLSHLVFCSPALSAGR